MAQAWLSKPGEIDIAPCLERAGFGLEQQSYRGFSSRALAVNVLKISGYDARGTKIFKTLDGSVFQPGDEIVRARRPNEQVIRQIGDLDWVLHDLPAGKEISLDVMRGGSLLTVTLRMPDLPEAQREPHTLKRAVKLSKKSSFLGAM